MLFAKVTHFEIEGVHMFVFIGMDNKVPQLAGNQQLMHGHRQQEDSNHHQ
jgi:hypothetical protein